MNILDLFPIHKAYQKLIARPKEAQVQFWHQTNGVLAYENGAKYLMKPSGETVLHSEAGEFEIPGVRYPVQLVKWYMFRVVKSNPNRVALSLLALTALVIGSILAAYLPPNENPFGEYTLWIFPTLSHGFILVMNLALVGGFAFLVLALMGRKAATEIYLGIQTAIHAKDEEPQLLEAGNPLAPDYLIWSNSPDETAESFFDRVAECRRTHGLKCFVVAAPFRLDKMVICHPAPADVETAEEVPGVRSAYVPGTTNAASETWDEYKYFLERVTPYLKDYCFDQRAKTQGVGALSALAAQMKAAFSVLLILCFAVAGMAQSKTDRLYNYLGTRAETIVPHDDVSVEFAFEGATLSRTGDGRTNLVNLMQKMRLFTDDDNAGALREVRINGNLLPPVKGSAKAQVMKMHNDIGQGSAVEVPDDNTPAGMSFDSVEARKQVDALVSSVARNQKKVFGIAYVYWTGFLQILDICFYVLLWICGLLLFVTKAMNNESRISSYGGTLYGRHFANIAAGSGFFLACFVVLGALVLLTAIYIRACAGDFAGVITMFFCLKSVFAIGWLAVLWVTLRFVDKIIPNPTVVSPGGDAAAYNYKGLQSGR